MNYKLRSYIEKDEIIERYKCLRKSLQIKIKPFIPSGNTSYNLQDTKIQNYKCTTNSKCSNSKLKISGQQEKKICNYCNESELFELGVRNHLKIKIHRLILNKNTLNNLKNINIQNSGHISRTKHPKNKVIIPKQREKKTCNYCNESELFELGIRNHLQIKIKRLPLINGAINKTEVPKDDLTRKTQYLKMRTRPKTNNKIPRTKKELLVKKSINKKQKSINLENETIKLKKNRINSCYNCNQCNLSFISEKKLEKHLILKHVIKIKRACERTINVNVCKVKNEKYERHNVSCNVKNRSNENQLHRMRLSKISPEITSKSTSDTEISQPKIIRQNNVCAVEKVHHTNKKTKRKNSLINKKLYLMKISSHKNKNFRKIRINSHQKKYYIRKKNNLQKIFNKQSSTKNEVDLNTREESLLKFNCNREDNLYQTSEHKLRKSSTDLFQNKSLKKFNLKIEKSAPLSTLPFQESNYMSSESVKSIQLETKINKSPVRQNEESLINVDFVQKTKDLNSKTDNSVKFDLNSINNHLLEHDTDTCHDMKLNSTNDENCAKSPIVEIDIIQSSELVEQFHTPYPQSNALQENFTQQIQYNPNKINRKYDKVHDTDIIDCLEKTYECKICGKLFNSKKILISHFRKYHRRSYKCNFCDNSYLHKKEFFLHIRDHTRQILLNSFFSFNEMLQNTSVENVPQ